MDDECKTYEIAGYSVQENGIVRNAGGTIIGRLSELDKATGDVLGSAVEQLVSCPFCGGAPYHPTNIKKNKSLTGCSNNKCPIFGRAIDVKRWENRAS